MKLLSVFVVVTLFAAVFATYCENCKYHTMCGTTDVGAKCVNLKSQPPTEAQKEALLNLHNGLRNKVALGQETRGNPKPQPSAANMMKMTWDNELATIAQRLVNQCVYGHDCNGCRTTSPKRFGVGQNIAMKWSTRAPTEINFADMASGWYEKEVDLFSKDAVAPYIWNYDAGHYSQVCWWNSRLLGCGGAIYETGNGLYYTLIACNYGSGGNMPGANMYTIGAPASDCPAGTKKDTSFTGLCAIEQSPVPSEFSTDDVLLGMPSNVSPSEGACQAEGFRA